MADRERLAKLLGMLGSDYDGERATAGRMIAQMAKAEGKGIAEFCMGGGVQIVYRDRIVEKTVYRERPDDDLRAYRPPPEHKKRSAHTYKAAGILKALRKAYDDAVHDPSLLDGWDMEFIDDILMKCSSDYDLTYRQLATAWKIVNKVKKQTGEPLI